MHCIGDVSASFGGMASGGWELTQLNPTRKRPKTEQ